MDIEYKRMTQRYAPDYITYETYMNTILPFEFVSVIKGVPSTPNGKALYYRYSSDTIPIQLVDVDKLNEVVESVKRDLRKEFETGGGTAAGNAVAVFNGVASRAAGSATEIKESEDE